MPTRKTPSDRSVEEQLRALIPKSLGDVIRVDRDECRLALATDDELRGLAAAVSDAHCRHVLTHWQIVVIHLAMRGDAAVSSPHLTGRVRETGQSWMTSKVIGIDEEKGMVQTQNSRYRVLGSRVAESELDLPYICATLNYWRIGQLFGVPAFFF